MLARSTTQVSCWSSVYHEYLRSIAIHYLHIKIRWSCRQRWRFDELGTLARSRGPGKTATASIVSCVTDPIEPWHVWEIKKNTKCVRPTHWPFQVALRLVMRTLTGDPCITPVIFQPLRSLQGNVLLPSPYSLQSIDRFLIPLGSRLIPGE